jgi:hypothetical protein
VNDLNAEQNRHIADDLTAEPVSIATARLPEADGGAPDEQGFYAWWLTDESALPSVPTSPHPDNASLGLAYIGIAPNAASSQSTIRSRMLGNHLGNALGSSTLRRGLAALLWTERGWRPFMKGKKPAFQQDDNAALTQWMEANLLVSWCRVEAPWTYEPAVIAGMAPPLNSDHNHEHPFYPTLRASRKHLMSVARAGNPATPLAC